MQFTIGEGASKVVRTRVLLVDDHPILRQSLRTLLADKEDMEVVGEAGDGRTAVQLAVELLPDVVVMDISMRDISGLEATRQIKAQAPKVKVIGLSMHSDERFIAEVFKAGGSGYVVKDSAFEELEHAIRAVAAGQTCPSPSHRKGCG